MQTCAEGFQQCGLLVPHGGRHQMRIAYRRDCELGEGARERCRRRAEIKASRAARTALAAVTERIKRDAVPYFEILYPSAGIHNFARWFMAHDEGKPPDHSIGAQFPFVKMEIGAADA